MNANGTFLEHAVAPLLGQHVRLSLDSLLLEVLAIEFTQARRKTKHLNLDSAITDEVIKQAVKNVGLRPESSWTPKLKIATNGQQLSKVRASLHRLMEEDKAKYGIEITMEQLNNFESLVRSRLAKLVGKPPVKFKWQGQTWNSREFADRFIPTHATKHYNSYRLFEDRLLGKSNLKWIFGPGDFDISRLDPIIQELAEGGPVLGTFDVDERFADEKTGILSKKFVKPIHLDDPTGPHEVVYVGFELDDEGDLIGLFFQTSWGDSGGPIGLYEVLIDYIEEHYQTFSFKVRPERLKMDRSF